MGTTEPKLGKAQDRKAFTEALAEHDGSRPAPTDRELGEILRQYLRAENAEQAAELEIKRLRAEKSKLARSWVVLRGSAGTVICRGETWSVQTTRWGGFCFRRYTAPAQPFTIEIEDSPAPESPSKPPPKKAKPRTKVIGATRRNAKKR